MRSIELEQFLEDEVRLEMWKYRTQDGFPLWALIRPIVMDSVIIRKGGLPNNQKVISTKRLVLKPRFFIEHIRVAFKLALKTKTIHDALFFTPAHFLNYPSKSTGYREDRVQGYYYQEYSNPLIFQMPNNAFFTRKIQGLNAQNVYLLPSITVMMAVARKCLFRRHSIDDADKKLINSIVEASEGLSQGQANKRVLHNLLSKMNAINWQYEKMVKLIDRKLSNKCVFVHCGCYLGGISLLIWHLHKRGFIVVEPQHGYIGQNHPGYNYPKAISQIKGIKSVFPDYFLAFGDEWAKNVLVPSKIVAVGNPYLNLQVERVRELNNNKLLIISQGNEEERNIVKYLAKKYPDREILFKLHPREIAFVESYNDLEMLHNVTISGRENESILPMIAESDVVIGNFSTALFEALAFPGKMICCFPHPYTLEESQFNLFENETDLVQLIEGAGKRVSVDASNKYWKNNWSSNINELRSVLGMREE